MGLPVRGQRTRTQVCVNFFFFLGKGETVEKQTVSSGEGGEGARRPRDEC